MKQVRGEVFTNWNAFGVSVAFFLKTNDPADPMPMYRFVAVQLFFWSFVLKWLP